MARILVIGGCGYIGSALTRFLVNQNFSVFSLDDERWGNFTGNHAIVTDYQNVTRATLSEYDVIVHLAGHSSVLMAQNDRHGALLNNVVFFERLLGLLSNQKFIYASSSSVYTGAGASRVREEWNNFQATSVYDISKYAGDCLAAVSPIEYYALRFGTVCGHSPNLRTDVMINKMTKVAKEHGVIKVFNPTINRPILGMQDLCRAISSIITGPDRRGIYNLASFNTTVLELAREVSDLLSCPIEIVASEPSYDFSMVTDKFEKSYGFKFNDTPRSIVEDLLNNWNPAQQGIRQ